MNLNYKTIQLFNNQIIYRKDIRDSTEKRITFKFEIIKYEEQSEIHFLTKKYRRTLVISDCQ